jgi:hypothetical protein
MLGSLFSTKLFESRRSAKAFCPLERRIPLANEMSPAFEESKYISGTGKRAVPIHGIRGMKVFPQILPFTVFPTRKYFSEMLGSFITKLFKMCGAAQIFSRRFLEGDMNRISPFQNSELKYIKIN